MRSEILKRILQEIEDEKKTPEGQENERKKQELERLEREWDEKVFNEHNYKRRQREFFLNLLPESMFGMKPDLEWRLPKQMFDDAMFETCNIDETTAHTHMAMKFVLYRIIMPFEKWNDPFDRQVFYEYADKFFETYYNNH